MAKYLVSVSETYRVDSETEAVRLIEDAKQSDKYQLSKYTNEKKEVKQKGEVVDEYYKIVLQKTINDIKDPWSDLEIHYHKPGEGCNCEVSF